MGCLRLQCWAVQSNSMQIGLSFVPADAFLLISFMGGDMKHTHTHTELEHSQQCLPPACVEVLFVYVCMWVKNGCSGAVKTPECGEISMVITSDQRVLDVSRYSRQSLGCFWWHGSDKLAVSTCSAPHSRWTHFKLSQTEIFPSRVGEDGCRTTRRVNIGLTFISWPETSYTISLLVC